MDIIYHKRYNVESLAEVADSAPEPEVFDTMSIDVHALLEGALYSENYGAYTKARVDNTEYHAIATVYNVDGYQVELVAASSNL